MPTEQNVTNRDAGNPERESRLTDHAFSVPDLQNIPVLVPETSDQTWASYVGFPRVVDEPSHVSGENALPNSSQQYTGGYTCVFCGFHVQWNTTHDCPRAKENLLREILTELRALRQELKESKGK